MTRPSLVEQNEALIDFLDDLLTEDPGGEDEAGQTGIEAEQTAGGLAEELPQSGEAPAGVAAHQAGPGAHEVAREVESATGRIPIIPDWGREAFQAMVFKVGELSLAVPLQELAGVLEWKPEQVEQQAGSLMCLGHYPHAGRTLTVVDTARFIFPASHLAHLAGPGSRRQISRIILIDNGNIGLACDEVYEVIRILPGQVTWRSAKTRRQWLAGTMLKELIAVLDAPAAVRILADTLNMSR